MEDPEAQCDQNVASERGTSDRGRDGGCEAM
jgi:hypothetical protein